MKLAQIMMKQIMAHQYNILLSNIPTVEIEIDHNKYHHVIMTHHTVHTLLLNGAILANETM